MNFTWQKKYMDVSWEEEWLTHLYSKRKLTFCFLPVLFLVARLIFLLNYNIVITFLFFSICIYILEVFSLSKMREKFADIALFCLGYDNWRRCICGLFLPYLRNSLFNDRFAVGFIFSGFPRDCDPPSVSVLGLK